MQRNYHDTQAGVNDQEEPKPNYYAIIPASVRYCKDLQPAAKLLFGELVALTSTKGYCYAQNPYFMSLYDVSRSTIKAWIAALVDQGFIRVDYDAFTNERRIYVVAMQPPGGVAEKSARGGSKIGHPRSENRPQSITENNTKISTRTLNVADAHLPQAVQEGKGSASPPVQNSIEPSGLSSRSAWKSQIVADVIAVTGDEASRKRFKQLLDLADNAGAFDAWENALDALKVRLKAATGPVERPGAYFCTLLVSALNERGVAVPVGTSGARRSVRGAIAASLAAADAAMEGRS